MFRLNFLCVPLRNSSVFSLWLISTRLNETAEGKPMVSQSSAE